MNSTTKWLIGIIVLMVMAYGGIVTDALIESRVTAGQVSVHEFRIKALENELVALRARVRQLELGGKSALPEE